jgi:hypothetical protein
MPAARIEQCVKEGRLNMAKVPEELAQQTTERAIQQTTERAIEATNFGVNWVREIAEQSLDHTKGAVESFLTVSRRAVDGLHQQGSFIREQSMFLAEKTLSNTIDFGNKLLRVKEPQELVRLQSEFMTQQAQLLAEHTKSLEQSIVQTTNEMTSVQKEVRGRLKAV